MKQIGLADHRACPSREHCHVRIVWFVGGQTNDGSRRTLLLDQPGCFNATQRGQVDVNQSNGRLESGCLANSILTVSSFSGETEVRISLQHLTKEFTHGGMIINDENINHKVTSEAP